MMKLLPRVSRVSGLSAEEASSFSRISVRLKIVDRNGVPVANAPFNLEVLPPQSCGEECATHHHDMNRDTDGNGVVVFDIPLASSSKEEKRTVTLKALFDYPGKDRFLDPPILDKKEILFVSEPKEQTIVLEPGGGIGKALPGKSEPEEAPAEPSKADQGSTYTPIVIAGVFVVIGIIFIPMIVDAWRDRNA